MHYLQNITKWSEILSHCSLSNVRYKTFKPQIKWRVMFLWEYTNTVRHSGTIESNLWLRESFLLLEFDESADCSDRLSVCEMDVLMLFSVCPRKGQEHKWLDFNLLSALVIQTVIVTLSIAPLAYTVPIILSWKYLSLPTQSLCCTASPSTGCSLWWAAVSYMLAI